MNEKKEVFEIDTMNVSELDNLTKITQEVEESYYDIPFGNTAFQTRAFVIANSITPERSYRAIGLQLLSVLSSIKSTIIKQKIDEVRRQQNLDKLINGSLDEYEKEILRLELILSDSGDQAYKKRINDLLNEFYILYLEHKKLPKFTREQFEAGEENYFTQSLGRQVSGLVGASEAIINMKEDIKALHDYKETIKTIENLDSKTMEELRLAMPNQIENAQLKEKKEPIRMKRL